MRLKIWCDEEFWKFLPTKQGHIIGHCELSLEALLAAGHDIYPLSCYELWLEALLAAVTMNYYPTPAGRSCIALHLHAYRSHRGTQFIGSAAPAENTNSWLYIINLLYIHIPTSCVDCLAPPSPYAVCPLQSTSRSKESLEPLSAWPHSRFQPAGAGPALWECVQRRRIASMRPCSKTFQDFSINLTPYI